MATQQGGVAAGDREAWLRQQLDRLNKDEDYWKGMLESATSPEFKQFCQKKLDNIDTQRTRYQEMLMVAVTTSAAAAQQGGGMGSGGGASSAGLLSELEQLKTLVQQEVLPRLRKLEISESSRASSSSQSGKNLIDRKQRECKEAARELYGVEPRYCHVTERTWEEPEIVSCSHIISRGWHKRNPIDLKRAGLDDEWDPRGTLFFIKKFEQEFDRGKVCLVWSGLDDKQLDKYKVKVLDPNLLDKPLSSTLGGDTFRQVNGKDIRFLNDARPSKRAVNLHASWAHKQAASLSKQAPASGVVTLNEINELPQSVWSQSSWKEYLEGWLAKDS